MKTISMQDALAHLIQGHHLSREEARQVMSAVMEGDATPAQIGSLMTSIRIKGETTEEITGFADEMRRRAPRVPGNHEGLLDTCGTGGDGQNTFNISTATAIVAAAGGARVAKHGNRAMSSKSGSADVLEALGVNISLTAQQGWSVPGPGWSLFYVFTVVPSVDEACSRSKKGTRFPHFL